MWALFSEFGIKTWNHYSPMHLATSFRSRQHGKGGDCPVAEAKFEEYVSLPIHPRLTDEAIGYMVDAIKQLSQRPHMPRSSPAPLLTALMSLYVHKAAAPALDLPAEKAWEDFTSEVQSSALFSPSAPITTTRAPGRLDLMGTVTALHASLSLYSPSSSLRCRRQRRLHWWHGVRVHNIGGNICRRPSPID
jgi:hypothetical protein